MNTLGNVSVLTLFLPPFCRVQYTLGMGRRGPPGIRGIALPRRPPDSQAAAAAPLMTFRKASGELRPRRGLERKKEVGGVDE